MKTKYQILGVIFFVGLVLPHLDIFLIIVFFSWVWLPIIIILFLCFLILFGLGLFKGNPKLLKKGRQGLVAILLLIVTPFLSTITVRKYYQYRAESLIAELNEYKITNGHFPKEAGEIGGTEKIFNVHYIYMPNSDSFQIVYHQNSIVRTVYDNKSRQWEVYGWND